MKTVLFILPTALFASLPAADGIDCEKLKGIDAIVEATLKRENTCPGAVVLVLHGDDVVYRKAFGFRALEPNREFMTVDTIFDMASVTKPVATGTSIHKLIEEGKLKPSDTVAKHWPEFAANGKGEVTVKQCLTHTTGLTADNSIKDYANGKADAMRAIANLKLEAPAGTRVRYSDVGFIVLGELVEKISGMPLDQYAEKHVFQPLKMHDTNYEPRLIQGSFNVLDLPKLLERVAPTGLRDKKIICGKVHDPRAFAMGGVAGHAGLFSTADDLARYARMMLHNGELDGVRILSEDSVKRFTIPRELPQGQRSLGWDVNTSFSAQRGNLFPAGTGYGHTGFTGTSVWIDPPSKTAVIILTNRVHPNDKGNVTTLRREIATLVASATAGISERQPKKVEPKKPVLAGADVLARDNFSALKGKKIGLVTNHTGRLADGTSLVDALAKADGVKLVALFSPEHGIRGEKDEKVGDSKDEKTGLPVFSLYGERRKPDAKSLEGIDTLVYDLQDIGCRFYTFISTLGLVMEAAKAHNVSVVVLDRPNPIGGLDTEGPLLDAGISNFVGFHKLPLRHGLTVDELATMFNKERDLNIPPTVIKCEGWHRGDTFEKTGLPWRNPSPNMRHLTAAHLYPGVGLIEFTNVSVGRGTERPFEWIGAPWIDGRKLAAALNAKNVSGVSFIPVNRTPVSGPHKDKLCGGMDIVVKNMADMKPLQVGLALITALRDEYPKEWDTKKLNTLLLHKATLEAIQNGKTAAEIESSWQTDQDAYRERRKAFLLYGD